MKQTLLSLLLALAIGALIFLAVREPTAQRRTVPRGFVSANGTRFVLDGHLFRFIGANVAVMYREDERRRMPETLRQAAENGIRVVRVWANGEGTTESGVQSIGGDKADWPRTHPFRRAPDDWNEEAFVHLDHVLAEAGRNDLRVQLVLVNWWRDTGGVTQYLRWAGINDAADEHQPFGINLERAMLFYTNAETRRLYRQHVEKIIMRRNTVTGMLYRDDPAIMSYELMNEAQAPTGRWEERRAWMAEMSAYIKSLDSNHLITPGTWGYRNAVERRAWLAEHKLPNVDFCDVHNYPRDDHDTFVDSGESLRDFINNRAAASFSINKPIVFGEFGMSPGGYKDLSQVEWFRAYFTSAARAGVGGAMFWILTPDAQRGYGISYTDARDDAVRAEISRAASSLDSSMRNASPPRELLEAGRHLVPRQFAFTRSANDTSVVPMMLLNKEASVYRFWPEQGMRGRFERMDGGAGFVWGAGVGFFEYVIPARENWHRVGEIIVRAHLQPVVPQDAGGRVQATRATLYINDTDCGARLVPLEQKPQVLMQEWRVRSLIPRLAAARGKQFTIRFAVKVDADQPFGINISNFPDYYEARESRPIEVEVR